ncbi:MAG: ACT domain-containing protein [Desulfobulbaceae bacterium]|nr:ACT domain-containing protein [Desulfobulbaceae bacterium]
MTDKRKQFIISVMSRDRVGIIYELSSTISAMEGDLADTRQQVLQGYFSMILYASFPAEITEEQIKKRLLAISRNSEEPFEISVKEVSEPTLAKEQTVPADTYVLTARGHDKPGFVATVAGFCAEQNINILDLATTVSDDTYIMILFVDLSRCKQIEQVRSALDRFNGDNGLHLVLQHHDIFKATNEIKML